MHIKLLLAISLAVVLSGCAPSEPKTKTTKRVVVVHEVKEVKKEPTTGHYIWPIFFGSGSFFFSEMGPAFHMPGYGFSGGLTASYFLRDFGALDYRGNLFAFSDLLYSFRSYDGHPQKVKYHIDESTVDLAFGGGFRSTYIGGYLQFPNKATVRVRDWTIEDFRGLDRSTSFSFMFGYRMTAKYMGIDFRFLLGQGPGSFLSSSLGDYWLGQVSVGVMAGF